MASMVFASSLFSVQSFVKLKTNSNYSHPSCYIPRVKNSYLNLSYKNISHIESSNSSFFKGDINFSISSPKFPRIVSTYSPSLNIIKACDQNIYHYPAFEVGSKTGFEIRDRYNGKVLLIVNIPMGGSKWARKEIKFLNDLRERYRGKISCYGEGFEVLGFFYEMENTHHHRSFFHPSSWLNREKDIPEIAPGEEEEEILGVEEIKQLAKFPIFDKVEINDDHSDNLWKFMREFQGVQKINQEFEKFLIDGKGVPVKHFILYEGEQLDPQPVRPGEYPGGSVTSKDTYIVKATIDEFHWRDDPNYPNH